MKAVLVDKYIAFVFVFSMIFGWSSELKAQTIEKHEHSVLDNHLKAITIQEKFYNQLSYHALVSPDIEKEIKQFFISNISTYKKMLHGLLHEQGGTTMADVEAYFPTITNALIADFNKQERFQQFQNGFRHEAHSSTNSSKGKGPKDKGIGDPCTNVDLETCDFTGWDMTQGDVNANAYGYVNVTPTTNWGNGSVIGFPGTSSSGSDQHFIVSGGTDPNVPIQMINPNGGSCSAIIGDGNGTGGKGASIAQTFLVDSNNTNFSYSFAAVLEDPSGHSLGEKPFFKVRVFDQNGNSIVCGEFNTTAGDGSPGWVNTGTVQYRDWSTVFVPLNSYVGQNVTVEVTVGDCSQSGHYGYAYFDASCAASEILASDTVICGDPITLTAPPGAGSYLWSPGGQTTQTITVTNPGTYDVALTTFSGCSLNLSTTIYADTTTPTAIFSADTVCFGVASVFNDLSTVSSGAIVSWEWDFDNDGVVDNTSQNPSYTFPAIGTYPVNLNVSAGNGSCDHDTTINVVVTAVPTAAFSFTNECFGTTTGFTDLSNPNGGVITSWEWDFDNNGVVDNNMQNPSNGYSAAGIYTAGLQVSTAFGCTDSITMQVVVNPIPAANFSVPDVCFNTVSSFTDSSTVATGNITNWVWNFGDGSGTSVNQHPNYSYSSPGTYPVTLTVTSDSGCIHTYIDSAKVYFLPTAAFSTNDVCLNVAASFADNSNGNGGVINSWSWDMDNNGTVDHTNQNPGNNYAVAGSYNVQLIVLTNSGCSDTVVHPIEIFPMPTADFSFANACLGTAIDFIDNSAVSTGSISTWNWSFGNTNSANIQNPSENYLLEGVYDVELIVSTANGCADTVMQQVEVWPTPVVNFSPTEVCLNGVTQFTDLSTVSNTQTNNNIVQWSWEFDVQGTSSLQNPTYVFNTEGVFPTTLTVTTNNGCTDSITLNVTVNPLPQLTFDLPTSGCAPVCMNFNNTSSISSGLISTYTWDFGDNSGSTAQSPAHCFENSSRVVLKEYDVTLTATSDKGCSSTLIKPQMITVFPIPLADFTVEPEITDIYDREITFTDVSTIASSWDWDFGDGATGNIANPIHEYSDTGTYSVHLYIDNIYGCKDTVERKVRVKPTYAIWIPNVFTPNGDGLNDYFFVDGYGFTELDTRIFDRWGVEVFHGHEILSSWDGVYKGDIVQEDVYVFKVSAKDVFGEWHDFVGRVTVLK